MARMAAYHQLRLSASTGGVLFECEDGCGRRLVVDRGGSLTVIDRGDPYALHRGAADGVELGAPAISELPGPS